MNCSMQIDVPHSEYGHCTYIMPVALQGWLVARDLRGEFCGQNSWGDGYTNGITNKESVYLVRDIQKEDGLIFKIMFSKCKVHIVEFK